MDHGLRKQLESIEKQVDVLYAAAGIYLSLDAATDHLLAKLASQYDLALSSPDKNISEAMVTRLAKANVEWAKHKAAVALAEADFNKQKHLLDLKNKAYDALHLSLKIDHAVIKRQL